MVPSVTAEEVLRSYETREVGLEEDSGSTQLGQKNTGKDTRTKITHIEHFGYGIIGTVLSVSYGTWDKRPATLILIQFNFRSRDGALRLRSAEVSVSFETHKRPKQAVHGNPPILRCFYPQRIYGNANTRGKICNSEFTQKCWTSDGSASRLAGPSGGRQPLTRNDSDFSIEGRAWSNKKREDNHQVFWKIREAGNDGIPYELKLAAVVEHQGPFQGIVEVEAKAAFGPPCISFPWSADDPLLFDSVTRKGRTPPKLEFDALTEEDWDAFVHGSHTAHPPLPNTSSRIEHSDIAASSITSESSGKSDPSGKVYRVRGIPYDYTCDGLATALESYFDIDLGCGGVLVHSFADYPYRHEKVAIVSFPRLAVPFKNAGYKDEWEISCKYTVRAPLRGHEQQELRSKALNLVIDTHFRGFTALGHFVESSEHKIDLIAISGLGGHAFGSFKERGGPHMWLQDRLAEDLQGSPPADRPYVRILIYGYNTHLEHSLSFQTITDLAGRFQTSLRAIRTGIASERPLVFIGHSLGGLIVKQALVNMGDGDEVDRANLKSTYGALFFGVPNRGMDIKSLVPMVGDRPNRYLLECLGKNSEFLRALSIDFPRVFSFPDSQILSFYETLESPTAKQEGDKWEMSGKPTVLVDMTSATHGRPWENNNRFILAINRDHSNLVKFSKYDEDYESVLSRLRTFIAKAESVIRKRFEAAS